MNEGHLASVYMRVEIGGRITPAEEILLIRDFHKRLTELETKNVNTTAPKGGSRTDTVSRETIPSD